MRVRGEQGFTLLELLVTVALAAILLGIGIPSFIDTIRNNRMAATSNDLLAAIHLARGEAVKRRAPITVCSSANPLAGSPTCSAGAFNGWVVFADYDSDDAGVDEATDGDIAIDGDEVVLQAHGALPDSIRAFSIPPGASYVSFAGTGFPRTFAGAGPATTGIMLCDQRGHVSIGGDTSAARILRIDVTGRPQILRTVADLEAAGGCPPL